MVTTIMVGLIGAAAVAVVIANKRWFQRWRQGTAASDLNYPRGGELADLNRLLEQGRVSPEEYDLLKRRILAGQVY